MIRRKTIPSEVFKERMRAILPELKKFHYRPILEEKYPEYATAKGHKLVSNCIILVTTDVLVTERLEGIVKERKAEQAAAAQSTENPKKSAA